MLRPTQAARLVDPATVRALLFALRGELDAFEPPATPDAALVTAVAAPFDSVETVGERLAELESLLRARGDRRAVFLTIYGRMTREVVAGIDAGAFADPAWMRRYLVAFAEAYRRAFLAFETGELEAVPDPWRVAFGSALEGELLVAQDSLLGVNAHITYDLAFALAEVGIDPDRAAKYADHRAIDAILRRLVDAQQAALAEQYAAGVADVDRALGRLDERLTLRSMTASREGAWRGAVALSDGGALARALARRVIWAAATGGAFFIRGPRLPPAEFRALRRAEREGVDLETLLGAVEARLDETEPAF